MRPRWWILVAFGLVVAAAADPFAYTALRTLLRYEHVGEVREGLTAAKFFGSGLGTFLVAVAVGVCDRWRRAAVLLLVVAAAGLAAVTAKCVVGRERPSHLDQPPGRERLLELRGPLVGFRDPGFRSFPSGHAAAAAASATALAAFYPPATAVVWGVAVATGVNRIVKHQHFASDVAVSWLLGWLLARWLLARPPIRRWWSVEPVDIRRVRS